MTETEQVAARRRSVAQRTTDATRWMDPDSYLPFWDGRAVAVGPLLRDRRWVCDIGCGRQALRTQLGAGTRYLPADIRGWTGDTEICELNQGRLPRRSLLRCDVAVMLGVLEYIVDPGLLLTRLHRYAEHLLLTYCVPELWTVDRAGFGWVNALSESDLRALLIDAGYMVTGTCRFEDRQLVVQARARSFGAVRRLRRSAARGLVREAASVRCAQPDVPGQLRDRTPGE